MNDLSPWFSGINLTEELTAIINAELLTVVEDVAADGSAAHPIRTTHLMVAIADSDTHIGAALRNAGFDRQLALTTATITPPPAIAARHQGPFDEHLRILLAEAARQFPAGGPSALSAAQWATHLLTLAVADMPPDLGMVLEVFALGSVQPEELRRAADAANSVTAGALTPDQTLEHPAEAPTTTANTSGAVHERSRHGTNPSETKHLTDLVKLESYGFITDMVAAATAGVYDPYIGRSDEISAMETILARRRKPNLIVVGPAGVGKTAMVEALATRIATGESTAFGGHTVLNVDVPAMVAGTKSRGDFEDRMGRLLTASSQAGRTILFFDEIHMLTRAGAGEGAMTAASLLKPLLARGDLQVIGATTTDELRIFEKDAALMRRFTVLRLDPMTADEAVQVVAAAIPAYRQHHQVTFEAGCENEAVRLAQRLFPTRHLPDSALDLVDETAASVAIRRTTDQVTTEDLRNTAALMANVPVDVVDPSQAHQFSHLTDTLNSSVIGQTAAVATVASAVMRRRAGLGDATRPVSLLFAGPSGVGKSHLTAELAAALGGPASNLVSFDMGEFTEPETVSRLLGAPPGYQGYKESGELIEAVRRQRSAVIVFEDLDKAHPQVVDTLLGLLDAGRLTDSKGFTANFSDTVVVMTVSVEASTRRMSGLGTSQAPTPQDATTSYLKRTFRPEFLNRIDDVVQFNPLQASAAVAIAVRMVASVIDAAITAGVTLTVDDEVFDLLATRGSDPTYGVRPLRRLIAQHITDPLTDLMLEHASAGRHMHVSVVDGTPTVTLLPQPAVTAASPQLHSAN